MDILEYELSTVGCVSVENYYLMTTLPSQPVVRKIIHKLHNSMIWDTSGSPVIIYYIKDAIDTSNFLSLIITDGDPPNCSPTEFGHITIL